MKKFLPRQMISTTRIVALLALVFSIFSCEEDPNKLGLDLLPPSDDFVLKADSSAVFGISMVPQDTVTTHAVYLSDQVGGTGLYLDTDTVNLLGDYSDKLNSKLFGDKKADMLLRFLPYESYNDSFPNVRQADSLVLYLKIDTVLLGKKDANLKYQIYSASKIIVPDEKVYSNTDLSVYKGNLLGEGTFNLSSDTVRIAFNQDNNLRDALMALSNKNMNNDTTFQNVLKGFYITVEKQDDDGAIALFNTGIANYSSTRLMLYYNDTATYTYFPRTTVKTDDFYGFNGAFSLKTDLTNTIIATETDHAFVQGMLGASAQLNLTDPVETWKDSGIIAINKVELTVVPDTAYLSTALGIKPAGYTKTLQVYYKALNSDGVLTKYPIGYATYKKGVYNFNITSYYQFVLRNKVKHGPLYLGDYNTFRSTEVLAINKIGSSKLKIIYSKIN